MKVTDNRIFVDTVQDPDFSYMSIVFLVFVSTTAKAFALLIPTYIALSHISVQRRSNVQTRNSSYLHLDI